MSSRWAFLEGFQVKNADGNPQLDRLRIIQTPLGGIYLHRIHAIDDGRDPHDHPWNFISIVLAGNYIDQVWPDPRNLDVYGNRTHYRWKPTITKRSMAHKIVLVAGTVWTLVFVGPKGKSWRFWTPEGPVDWKDYDKLGEQSEPVQ